MVVIFRFAVLFFLYFSAIFSWFLMFSRSLSLLVFLWCCFRCMIFVCFHLFFSAAVVVVAFSSLALCLHSSLLVVEFSFIFKMLLLLLLFSLQDFSFCFSLIFGDSHFCCSMCFLSSSRQTTRLSVRFAAINPDLIVLICQAPNGTDFGHQFVWNAEVP